MNISTLITYLNTISGITSVCSDRIFWGQPRSEQTNTYMTVNVVTEIEPTKVEKRNRLEFRVIGGDSTVTFGTLATVDTALLDAIRAYNAQGVYKSVVAGFTNLYNEKQQKILIRDIIIYYTT